MVVQIYHRALGSLSVASYDSQGYGEGILTRLHTGMCLATLVLSLQSKSFEVRLGSAVQYVTPDAS
jgi:hypothetical protein